MRAESISTVVSFVTLIVVATASVAAIVQLHHLRTSNQLNGMLEIMNQWNIPAVQQALAEVQRIPEKMEDPEYARVLLTHHAMDRANYPELLAMDLWEQIGTFSKRGLIDESILLDITSDQLLNAWRDAHPAIAAVRQKRGLSMYENFEYLAVRATLWNRRYPGGTYPAGLQRMSDLT